MNMVFFAEVFRAMEYDMPNGKTIFHFWGGGVLFGTSFTETQRKPWEENIYAALVQTCMHSNRLDPD